MPKDTVYEIAEIACGIKTTLVKTSVLKEAKAAYQKQYRASGTTPRVFINGVMLTIAQGEKLFIDSNSVSPWRGKKPTNATPKYIDTHAKIAEEKNAQEPIVAGAGVGEYCPTAGKFARGTFEGLQISTERG